MIYLFFKLSGGVLPRHGAGQCVRGDDRLRGVRASRPTHPRPVEQPQDQRRRIRRLPRQEQLRLALLRLGHCQVILQLQNSNFT